MNDETFRLLIRLIAGMKESARRVEVRAQDTAEHIDDPALAYAMGCRTGISDVLNELRKAQEEPTDADTR